MSQKPSKLWKEFSDISCFSKFYQLQNQKRYYPRRAHKVYILDLSSLKSYPEPDKAFKSKKKTIKLWYIVALTRS